MYACMHVCMYACMRVCVYAYMQVQRTHPRNTALKDAHLVHHLRSAVHEHLSVCARVYARATRAATCSSNPKLPLRSSPETDPSEFRVCSMLLPLAVRSDDRGTLYLHDCVCVSVCVSVCVCVCVCLLRLRVRARVVHASSYSCPTVRPIRLPPSHSARTYLPTCASNAGSSNPSGLAPPEPVLPRGASMGSSLPSNPRRSPSGPPSLLAGLDKEREWWGDDEGECDGKPAHEG